jgi:glycerophosphoryl diester phosphodiesterase
MKIIGHRGARGLAPENTIAGFKKALEHHVDEIEFDVRVTKDKIAILCHNPKLLDVAGNKLVIARQTYAELLIHKADLVTFEAALEAIGHQVPLLVEVKPKEPIGPIVAVIKKFLAAGWQPEYFLLGSRSQKTLVALHKKLPTIEKVVIEPWSGVRARIRARQVQTKRLNMNYLWLWSGFLSGMHHAGYQIAAYPLNDPAKAKKWEKYGLSGVITDFPDRFEK